ncbi:traX family protein [Lentilactobacillus otakiensis DSM 19908 = JCM 15040]|uniref:TraX family protein n=2 Tax=Lentilactobacillus otakiensis TaxID=481720 RepID=S4NSB9_9LACO|nr:traX family protein [Lentilactobacillus otakiensis DSM 19908 = JCM 15040]
MDSFALINNIFGDLFVGVLTMYGIQQISEGRKHHQQGKIWGGILAIILPLIFGVLTIAAVSVAGTNAIWAKMIMLLPSPMLAENSFMLYLGPLMYLVRKKRSWQMLAVVAMAIVSTGFNFSTMFTTNFQWLMVFAIVPMFFYNGKLGRSMKGFFYAFYPLHIWILYLIAWFMGVGH